MGPALGLAARHTVQLAGQGNVVGTAQPRHQGIGLRHVADGPAEETACRGQVVAQNPARAGRRRQQS